MIFTLTIANAQSKKQQIENLTLSLDSLTQVVIIERNDFNIRLDSINQLLSISQQNFEVEIAKSGIEIEKLTLSSDSLNQVVIIERNNFNIRLDSINQLLSISQQNFEVEIAKSSIEIENLNIQLNSLSSINDSINRQFKIMTKKIDSLTLHVTEQLADIESLNPPKIDRENDWHLIESNIKWTEKDYRQEAQWLNLSVFNGSANIYTSNCYSYIMDATDYYWGYPGSIEKTEFESKWKSNFDLNYSSFSHPFQNGNCGWSSFRFRNIEFLGVLNKGDWYKLTIEGGCSDNDFSQTLVRIVKVIEENDSFKIANFLSLQDY